MKLKYMACQKILSGKFIITLLLSQLIIINCWAQQTDTEPPKLVGFSFDPTQVDVSTDDAFVNVSLQYSDDLSGFHRADVYFYSPSFGQFVEGSLFYNSGSALSGESVKTFTIPKFSEAGDWRIQSISLYDNVGNSQRIDSTTLESLGFSSILTVINSQNQDQSPPFLSLLEINPLVIDVSSGNQSITFNLTVDDSPAGVRMNCESVCFSLIGLRSPTGKQFQAEYGFNASLTSGTTESGTWQIVVTLPQYAESGIWSIDYIGLVDNTNNVSYLTKESLKDAFTTTTISVISSPSDTQKPELISLDITPKFVDSTTGNNTIKALLKATDNLSGLDTTYSNTSPNIFNPTHITYKSPSGNQRLLLINSITLVAGTNTNGTWEVSGGLSQFSEAGTWKPDSAFLVDNAGNITTYNNTQLAALGVPNLDVILPSLTNDGAVSDTNVDTTIKDTVFQDRAQVIVPANVLTTGTSVTIDVLDSNLNLPIPAGFSTTGTNFVNIKLDPKPTPPYPAPGITLVLPVSNQTAPGTNLTLYRVDPISGNLTPEPSVIAGQSVIGTVNADGLSATFTGVAALSTVVGLVPSGAVLGDLNGDEVVDCADIAIVKNAFGKRVNEEGFDSRADINRDNVVNIRDLAFVSKRLPKETTCRVTSNGVIKVELSTNN